MPYISATRDVDQADTFWLKDVACANMRYIQATFDTSHFERSWSKDFAPKNI